MVRSDLQVIDVVEMVIKQPGQAERVVRLQEGATRLGRAEDNEVVLSDVGVSRRHAQVYVSPSEVTVEDLGSGNGTYYNGYRVQSQPLADGDEIVIDPFVLQFRIRGQDRGGPRPAPPASPGAASAAASLEVVVGTGMAGAVFPITARGLSIGRSEDRDVVIPDPAASRHHCQITPEMSEYTLRDMGSANGVFVNAVRVRECQLADGDLVRIGNTEMRFIRNDQPGYGGGAPRAPSPAARGGAWRDPRPPGMPTDARGRMGQPTTRLGVPEKGGTRSFIWIALVGVVAFIGIIALAILAVILIVFLSQSGPPTPDDFPPQPPRWKLELPPSLPSARVDALFNEGRAKMKEDNHREALQDFYRILNAEPGRFGVGKFAFAAGEAMVLEALAKDFDRLAEERASQDKDRARLLRRAQSKNYKTAQKAQQDLRRRFGADPVVLEVAIQNKWFEPGEEVLEMRSKAEDATSLMAGGDFAGAAPLLRDVLKTTKDPATRKQALANLKLAHQELARKAAPVWTDAVILEAGGQRGEARSRFKKLAEDYPTLPSSRAHLERY